MAVAYLGLGSNIGDRVGFIQQATSLLSGDENIKIVSTSSFYETEPWHFKTDNWFVNAVIVVSTPLYPHQLLKVCNRVESQLGRKRSDESGYNDRTIDIDILFYDDKIYSEEENGIELTIPHPRVHERAFMLVPLLEVAPSYIHPVFKKTISDIYEDIDDPETVCLYGTRFI
ncbi:MAG: 2-amino-4-hydroxy-6-hydroxymethyldihydropteridine diphosphokinase [Candidatus Gastranaerophilales bacterium]|nr:2-amino-4-hydroxy-6-hydroxymethyldihydropteridine diphosphokinase [Candidatus Gastranaerophilales bacterium]